ncbi:MAG: glycoside hydrolase family 32 protein [Segetibacter sp.]|jgi:fructan beta-fructosidase|nr:glycoside hydrolase family 32 protein [Segetibacter sp.]
MTRLKYIVLIALFTGCATANKQALTRGAYNEPHRPQIHFSPEAHWMNDPNGMVYYNNTYHLFYQYFPGGTKWGPMHWGHATSKDLMHWEHQPVALYPDSLGYIFSGSAVADVNNTSGFARDGKIPLVAIFTHHDPAGEKAGTSTYQNQSIAYSLDDGKTWTKYANNPVVKNPGIKDFRDPKVEWYEAGKKWIMTLAVLDHITFYSSPDLKNWTKESEFGKEVGAHGGVWECPDLFSMDYNGQRIWILIVNINPGGPNGGSATQYFTGQFDGHTFTPFQTDTRWLDYGPDEYAGITFSNTGNRKIFLGWMSNWQYAQVVPTDPWRSAMTIPRDLGIEKVGEKYLLTSRPSPELNTLVATSTTSENINATDYNVTATAGKITGPFKLQLSTEKLETFSLTLSNNPGEKVVVGFDKSANEFYIDRTNSGKTEFDKGFAKRHIAPRFSSRPNDEITLVVDNASIELFADNGLTTMTEIFFPHETFSKIQIQSPNNFLIKSLQLTRLKSIWLNK